MVAALLGVVVRSPAYLSAAFNPVTLNGCVIALSVVALVVSNRVPSARVCLRRRPKGEE
jgi:hypothetical protein